jgi:hypothetical protein
MGESPYALIPILAHIPANAFVETWLGSPNANWRSISYALRGRHEGRRLEDELKREREWAVQVFKLLEAEACASDGFRALRIERIIRAYPVDADGCHS